MRRLARISGSIVLAILTSFSLADANPYLAKAGERPVHVRIATCAVSGGFAHLYTALENQLFEPYGFKLEHVFIRGSSASLAALMADEIQFLFCWARAGDLIDRLSRMLVKKLNVAEVTMRPIGGSQTERYQAMAANIVQGVVITPPLDVRAKNDGYNVVYRLIDLHRSE